MNAHSWKLQIIRAAADPDGDIMTAMAAQLAACESAKAMLRNSHYGQSGDQIDSMVREVLENR